MVLALIIFLCLVITTLTAITIIIVNEEAKSQHRRATLPFTDSVKRRPNYHCSDIIVLETRMPV